MRREESAGGIEIRNGRARRRAKGRIDYTLRIKVNASSQPVAVALIEAKAEHLPPNHGLEQAKLYAESKRLNVPFVYATNGHLFVEYDRSTGLTTRPRPLTEFPTPGELRQRYEGCMGFSLEDPVARPLLAPYPGGEATRRYYQDAAIRSVLEKIARTMKVGESPRALLSLATGAGKTFIAVNLLRRIAAAGQLRRALFICDRDELRSQALGAFHNAFGADAAEVTGNNPQKNARILIATYQTLGVATEESDASFLIENYPINYFSHIIIDECHRSAWGKWQQVLTRNSDAIQIGLTATPRQLTGVNPEDYPADQQITADNYHYFGEPVYEYDLAQGIEDGYLAACEIIRRDIFLDQKIKNERETGIKKEDLEGKTIRDATSGTVYSLAEIRAHYNAESFEDLIQLPDRVQAMVHDLFELLLASGGPEQKTIIFCARDTHADDVAVAMNNRYIDWCRQQGHSPAPHYAFKCTAASSGNDFLPDLRGLERDYFIATTVELLTTGVDVPIVRNIVFFKYVQSPIAFYQMVGRGTRIHSPSGKLMFRVYDYTNATRLFGAKFLTSAPVQSAPSKEDGGGKPERKPLEVEGFEVWVTPAGRYILTIVDGKTVPMTVEDYQQVLAGKLVSLAPTLEEFRRRWIQPGLRQELLASLPDAARSAELVRTLADMTDFDLYDVLAELGYGMAPRTRRERAAAFAYKHAFWLAGLPLKTAATLRALAEQFAAAGTDALENPNIFNTPAVRRAGGLAALQALGMPDQVILDTRNRIFAA